MRKRFVFNIGQQSGEYFITAEPSSDGPGFYFIRRTRQDAIDLALQSLVSWLRLQKTPPKTKAVVEKTAKYVGPVHEVGDARSKRVQKFGGIPIRKVTPNETITVGVDV